MTSPFGDKLRELREKRGINKSSLAELIGVSQPLIGMVEAGNRRLPEEKIEVCAKSLGLTGPAKYEFMQLAEMDRIEAQPGAQDLMRFAGTGIGEITNMRARIESLERMLESLARRFPGKIPGAADRSDDATYGDLVWETLRPSLRIAPTDHAAIEDIVERACALRPPRAGGRR